MNGVAPASPVHGTLFHDIAAELILYARKRPERIRRDQRLQCPPGARHGPRPDVAYFEHVANYRDLRRSRPKRLPYWPSRFSRLPIGSGVSSTRSSFTWMRGSRWSGSSIPRSKPSAFIGRTETGRWSRPTSSCSANPNSPASAIVSRTSSCSPASCLQCPRREVRCGVNDGDQGYSGKYGILAGLLIVLAFLGALAAFVRHWRRKGQAKMLGTELNRRSFLTAPRWASVHSRSPSCFYRDAEEAQPVRGDPRQAAPCAEGQAHHLPVHVRRAEPTRSLRPQTEAQRT